MLRDALRLLPVIIRNWLRTRAQLQLEILALRHLSLPQITSGRMNGADHQGEVWI